MLTTVTRVLALPFLTEDIYQNLLRSVVASAGESVHLTTYPQVDAALVDEKLEQNIDAVIRIKDPALSLRTQSRVKIRQPLNTLYVRTKDGADHRVLQNADYAYLRSDPWDNAPSTHCARKHRQRSFLLITMIVSSSRGSLSPRKVRSADAS